MPILPDPWPVVEEKLTNSVFSPLYDFVDRLEPARPITIRPRVKIGVAVDLTERSAATVRMAGALAPNATISLLHAFQVPNHDRLRQLGASEEEIKRLRSEFYDRATREMGKLAVEQALTHLAESVASPAFISPRAAWPHPVP